MPVLRLSSRANEDLTEIAEYTTRRWGFDQAERYLAGIDDLMRSLATKRFAGVATKGLRPSVQRIRYRSHFIFFEADAEWITIVRVLRADGSCAAPYGRMTPAK